MELPNTKRYVFKKEYDENTDFLRIEIKDTFTKKSITLLRKLNGDSPDIAGWQMCKQAGLETPYLEEFKLNKNDMPMSPFSVRIAQ